MPWAVLHCIITGKSEKKISAAEEVYIKLWVFLAGMKTYYSRKEAIDPMGVYYSSSDTGAAKIPNVRVSMFPTALFG